MGNTILGKIAPAKRSAIVTVSGENADYLDQIKDPSIAPYIYGGSN